MPILIVPLVILAALLAVVVLMPLALVQRYRVGTSRQRARGWLAALNTAALGLSTFLFVTAAGLANIWVPDTLLYSASGLAIGFALGILGLWLTRWEPSLDALHYTPNRVIVLALVALVATRLAYGLFRAWQSWGAGLRGEAWFVAAGVAASMAAGGVVLAYYLTYWIGVRRRYRRHEARPLRRL